MSTRNGRVAALIAAGLAVTLTSGCGVMTSGLRGVNLPGGADLGDKPYGVTVEFADVVDLVPQSLVKVADVSVGSVRSITLDPKTWHAMVTVDINGDVRLPENAVARVRTTSLLGEKFVQLGAPETGAAGTLADGATIPIDRSGRAVEVEEVFGALSLLLDGGGVGNIKTIATELNKALKGNEPEIRSLLTNLDTLVGALDERKGDITRAHRRASTGSPARSTRPAEARERARQPGAGHQGAVVAARAARRHAAVARPPLRGGDATWSTAAATTSSPTCGCSHPPCRSSPSRGRTCPTRSRCSRSPPVHRRGDRRLRRRLLQPVRAPSTSTSGTLLQNILNNVLPALPGLGLAAGPRAAARTAARRTRLRPSSRCSARCPASGARRTSRPRRRRQRLRNPSRRSRNPLRRPRTRAADWAGSSEAAHDHPHHQAAAARAARRRGRRHRLHRRAVREPRCRRRRHQLPRDDADDAVRRHLHRRRRHLPRCQRRPGRAAHADPDRRRRAARHRHLRAGHPGRGHRAGAQPVGDRRAVRRPAARRGRRRDARRPAR